MQIKGNKKMKRIGIILTPDVRSNAYLSKLVDNKIKLDQIIFMNDNVERKKFSNKEINQAKLYGIKIDKSVKTILDENNMSFREFPFVDINNSELINFIKQSNMDFFIFTGGGILKSEILSSGPKFIHFHPGIVPFYRGSTCFYYSIINDDNCGVTAYVMDEKLDAGKIIHQKTFPKPSHIFIDNVFDADIRSNTMIDVLKNGLLLKENFLKQDINIGETYFVIHPVLKHIAILSCLK
jgi:methionyl-tRNA formyltransferase